MTATEKAPPTMPDRAKPIDRHAAANDLHENTQRYWMFLGEADVFWCFVAGQAAARALAGNTVTTLCLHFGNAGTALRMAEVLSVRWNRPVYNLAELEAAALKDPEPDNGAKRAHMASKVVTK